MAVPRRCGGGGGRHAVSRQREEKGRSDAHEAGPRAALRPGAPWLPRFPCNRRDVYPIRGAGTDELDLSLCVFDYTLWVQLMPLTAS